MEKEEVIPKPVGSRITLVDGEDGRYSWPDPLKVPSGVSLLPMSVVVANSFTARRPHLQHAATDWDGRHRVGESR